MAGTDWSKFPMCIRDECVNFNVKTDGCTVRKQWYRRCKDPRIIKRVKMADNKPEIKIFDKKDHVSEDYAWKFHPCEYGLSFKCEGKCLEFGFNSGMGLIDILIDGLPRLKAAINAREKMSAKDKAINWLKKLKKGQCEEDFVDSIIEAVKEDIQCPYPEACPKLTPKPELIQGYTAEQWQEIIDGGYLCEFSDFPNLQESFFGKLYSYHEITGEDQAFFRCSPDKENQRASMRFCRPAKIKGVMRPIFIEPSAPEAWCSFFGDHSHVGDERWCVREHTGHFPTATKYIEL